MKNIFQKIFSITNDDNRTRKILTILGIKIKFRSLKLEKIIKEDISNNRLITETTISKNSRIDIVDILASQKVNEETFKKYKNCNTGKSIVIIAPGPTLNYFVPNIEGLYIGLNRAVFREDINFDYFFMQDYIAVKDYIDKLGEERFKDTKKFFGIMKDYTYNGKATIPESISNRIGAERYCIFHQWEYFNNIFPRDIAYAPLATASSVAGSAVQFALYTNPKKIYVVGCDCSFDYFNEQSRKNNLNKGVYSSWQDIKQFMDIWYPETEIISVNPVGLKGLFKDVYTESFLKDYPETQCEYNENIEKIGI